MDPVRLSVTEIDTPAGAIVLVSRGTALVGLVYKDRWKGMEADLATEVRENLLRRRIRKAERPADALRRYFDGDLERSRTSSSTRPARLSRKESGRPFAAFPAGATWSYAQLARAIGKPSAVRAVAGANARNPVSVVVPCHRVIASDGKLAGYGGGIPRKRWLLAHEGAILA